MSVTGTSRSHNDIAGAAAVARRMFAAKRSVPVSCVRDAMPRNAVAQRPCPVVMLLAGYLTRRDRAASLCRATCWPHPATNRACWRRTSPCSTRMHHRLAVILER